MGPGPSTPKTDRAMRVPGMFTLLVFALATADRLQCEREARELCLSAGNAGGVNLGADPRPGDRLAQALFWHLSAAGVRTAGGSEAQRYPACNRQPPAGLSQVSPPSTGLTVMLELQY